MISFILLLAHLAVDFLFQPTKLVVWKQKSDWGVLVHVLILAVVCGVLLIPYWSQSIVLWFVAILVVTHFIQDKVKVWYEKNYNKSKRAYPFFVDQLLHFVVIFLISGYLVKHIHRPEIKSDFLSSIYFNEHIYIYASLLILFSYALDIVIFQLRRHKNPHMKYKRDYDSITKRVFAFAVFYVIFLLVAGSLQ